MWPGATGISILIARTSALIHRSPRVNPKRSTSHHLPTRPKTTWDLWRLTSQISNKNQHLTVV